MPERTGNYKIVKQKEIPLWSLFFRPRKLHLNWIWYTAITAEASDLLLKLGGSGKFAKPSAVNEATQEYIVPSIILGRVPRMTNWIRQG